MKKISVLIAVALFSICAVLPQSTYALTIDQNLSVGSTGPQVTALQNYLALLNLFHTSSTGYYGPLTKQAVAQMQTLLGLASVGTVGPKTREILTDVGSTAATSTPTTTAATSTNTNTTTTTPVTTTTTAPTQPATTPTVTNQTTTTTATKPVSGITVSSVPQLMSALQAAHGGDTIYLAPGTYSGVQLNNLTFSSPVTLTSANTSNPAVFSGIGISGTSGLTFDHVTISMVGTSDPYYAFRVYDGQNLTFNAVTVTGDTSKLPGDQASGFYLVGGSNISFTNSAFQYMNSAIVASTNGLTITNDTFTKLDKGGVELGGASNVNISNDSFINFIGTAGTHQDAVQIYTAGTTASVSNISVSNNIVFRGTGNAIQGIYIQDETGTLPYNNVTVNDNQVIGEAWDSIVVNSNVTGVLNVNNNTVATWPGVNIEGTGSGAALTATTFGTADYVGQINITDTGKINETGNVAQSFVTGDSDAVPAGNTQIGAIQPVTSLAGTVTAGVKASSVQATINEKGTASGNLLNGATGGTLYVADIGIGGNAQQAFGSGATTYKGTYGILTVSPNGSYSYAETADGLLAGQSYDDQFTATIANSAGQGTSITMDFKFTGSSVGDGGADTMTGGAGATTFSGFGAGSTLTSGVGADMYVFSSLAQSPVSSPTLIKSFKAGDTINLMGIDPRFHTVSQLDGHADELLVQQIGTGNWMVYGDTTGTGVANFQIHLTNVSSPIAFSTANVPVTTAAPVTTTTSTNSSTNTTTNNTAPTNTTTTTTTGTSATTSTNNTPTTTTTTSNTSAANVNAVPTVALTSSVAPSTNGNVYVPYGAKETLTWSSTNATSCTGSTENTSSSFNGTLPTSGTFTDTITSGRHYYVVCVNGNATTHVPGGQAYFWVSSYTPTASTNSQSAAVGDAASQILGDMKILVQWLKL